MEKKQSAFLPGDKWLFFKVYTQYKTADAILINNISPLIEKLENEKLINKWFFIRYNDPDFHLRVRFELSDLKYIGDIITLFHSSLKELYPYYFSKLELSTYEREIERYHWIEEAETLFEWDSKLVLSILKDIRPHDFNYRWKCALLLIENVFHLFSFNLERKISLLEQMSRGMKNEFGYDLYNQKQLNAKYRKYKKEIEDVLFYSGKDPLLNGISEMIDQNNAFIREFVHEEYRHFPVEDLNDLLFSFIHMSMNRLFPAKNRIFELVIYDFLYRCHSSLQARKKYAK